MSNALVSTTSRPAPVAPSALPPVPWRDPHEIAPMELAAYIRHLERACVEQPQSADLRTCLGVAHAVNYDVDKSMAALEDARAVDPENFWAQLKYAELYYRLRVLDTAEAETRHAAELATNPVQLAIARKQLHDIRALKQGCVRNVHWTKPLTAPVLVLSLGIVSIFIVMLWK